MVWQKRSVAVLVEEDDVDLLLSLDKGDEQARESIHILRHDLPWEILGVSRDATEAECIKAFRTKSLLLHPDKCLYPSFSRNCMLL